MRSIFLIRHGKTEANEQHLYCGSTDLPLSEAGAAQLRQLHYTAPENAQFVTSGMMRTRQTLQLLFGDVSAETDPRFREVDFGAFEMKSYEQLKDDPAYQTWLTGCNEENVTPGGESGRQMEQRVLEAFRFWNAQPDNLVIVAHGGVIASIMAQLFPEEGKNRYQWQPQPGHGYLLRDGQFRPIP